MEVPNNRGMEKGSSTVYPTICKGRVLWGTPPKFYHEQARKLLEAVVQVQLDFIQMYGH